MIRNYRTFILSCALVTCFLFSCENPENKEKDDSQKFDSLTCQVSGKLQAVIDLFKTQNNLPFTADTSLLFAVPSCDSLGTNEIKMLDTLWFANDLAYSRDYDLREFYKIDSLKAAGKYAEWCQKLDIGQRKFSTMHAVSKMKLDENTQILTWALNFCSYEACPYSSGQTIYFTVVYKGKVTQSFILAEYESAGDPPVVMERKVTGKLNTDGRFTMDVNQLNDEDMDQPLLEQVFEYYEFAIKEGKISLLKERKEVPLKIKRQKS